MEKTISSFKNTFRLLFLKYFLIFSTTHFMNYEFNILKIKKMCSKKNISKWFFTF